VVFISGGSIPDAVLCHVYVDAEHVRNRLREHVNAGLPGISDEFDPWRLAALLQGENLMGKVLHVKRVFFYDAVDEPAMPSGDRAEQQDHTQQRQRQDRYLKNVDLLNDTHVVTGWLRPGRGKTRCKKGTRVSLYYAISSRTWLGKHRS